MSPEAAGNQTRMGHAEARRTRRERETETTWDTVTYRSRDTKTCYGFQQDIVVADANRLSALIFADIRNLREQSVHFRMFFFRF